MSLIEYSMAITTLKNIKQFLFLFLLFSAAIASNTSSSQSKPTIAIQPFGLFNKEYIEKIVVGITDLFNVDVIVLPEMELPQSAYYTPRNISTTKGEYYDWGIFGLGMLHGRVCVVSTYRLKRGDVSQTLFLERLVKVVNHELGHVFGLDHCPVKGCLMEDAKGKIKTVDDETGTFCDECKKKLNGLLTPK
jgi:archaemetzincin